MLNNVELEIRKGFQGKVVIGENPQRAAYVVGNLSIIDALLL